MMNLKETSKEAYFAMIWNKPDLKIQGLQASLKDENKRTKDINNKVLWRDITEKH